MATDRDREKVHLWVDPDTKAEWKEYVEDTTEADSLTWLIRTAVTQYINSGGLEGARSQKGTSDVTVDNTEVVEGINRIEAQLSDLDDKVVSLQSMAEQSPELDDVMMKAHNVLPPQEPDTDKWHYERNITESDKFGSIAWEGTADAIADMIEVEPFWVEMALDKLESDSERVKSKRHGEAVVYWEDIGYQQGRYSGMEDN